MKLQKTKNTQHIKMSRLTNYIALAGLMTANVFTGAFVSGLINVYQKTYAEDTSRLPAFTRFFLGYASSANPTTVGIIGALLCCALFVLAERSERTRPHLPLLISCAWMVTLLHLAFAAIGFALPFVEMHSSLPG